MARTIGWRGPGLLAAVVGLIAGRVPAHGQESAAGACGVDTLLAAYVDEALTAHPDLASMQAMIEAQGQRARMAGAWMNPSLMLGVMNLPTSLDFGEDAMTMESVGFMVRIPFPGKLATARRAELTQVEVRHAELARMRLDMAAMVRMTYYELSGYLAVRQALLEGRSLAGDMVTAAQIMVSSAMGPQADVLRAQLAADAWGRRLIDNEQSIALARSRLAAALGRASAEGLADPVPAGEAGTQPPPALAEDERLEQTPARLVEKAEVEAARAQLDRARHQYWPDMEVTFTYGARGALDVGGDAMGTATGSGLRDMVSLEVSFPVPLFAGGNQAAAVRESQAMLRSAEAEDRAGGIRLRQEVRARQARLSAALQTYDLITTTLIPRAEETFRSSQAAYQAGSLPFMSLEEALMQTIMQHMEQAMAVADVRMARADLERLLGATPWAP